VQDKKISSNVSKGKAAEQQAAQFLEEQGYIILSANYHTRYGEIDLIAQDGNCLVFVEVKQRSSHRFGSPEEAVTLKKQQKLILSAQHYLQKNPWDKEMRFDMVAVDQNECRLYQNAWEAP